MESSLESFERILSKPFLPFLEDMHLMFNMINWQTYSSVIKNLLTKIFDLWQRNGFHITPNHYYQIYPIQRVAGKPVGRR